MALVDLAVLMELRRGHALDHPDVRLPVAAVEVVQAQLLDVDIALPGDLLLFGFSFSQDPQINFSHLGNDIQTHLGNVLGHEDDPPHGHGRCENDGDPPQVLDPPVDNGAVGHALDHVHEGLGIVLPEVPLVGLLRDAAHAGLQDLVAPERYQNDGGLWQALAPLPGLLPQVDDLGLLVGGLHHERGLLLGVQRGAPLLRAQLVTQPKR